MRRWKVYTRRIGTTYEWEASRHWTRSSAERWAVRNQDRLFDYWRVSTKRGDA